MTLYYKRIILIKALLAQSVEHWTFNPIVKGSNPLQGLHFLIEKFPESRRKFPESCRQISGKLSRISGKLSGNSGTGSDGMNCHREFPETGSDVNIF